MRSFILKLINILGLMISVAWLTNIQSWEPLLATVTCLATLIAQEVVAIRRPSIDPDVALFENFLMKLPSEGSISFIEDYDFHGPFSLGNLDQIYDFLHQWDKPEREFHDRGLDRKRKKLWDAIDDFTQLIGQHTSPRTAHLNSLSPHIQQNNPAEFARIGDNINKAADLVFKCHHDMVRVGRKKLQL